MDWIPAISIFVSAIVGFGVLFLQNQASFRLAVRQDRLQRINDQLRFFYGPLYAKLKLEKDLFYSFRVAHNLVNTSWTDQASPDQSEVWREWIEHRFMPINRELLQLATERTDLIEETELPECFRKLQLHVVGYELLLNNWNQGDYSQLIPDVMFPSELIHPYAEKHYVRLKAEQSELIHTQ